jgi:hypothetical protein
LILRQIGNMIADGKPIGDIAPQARVAKQPGQKNKFVSHFDPWKQIDHFDILIPGCTGQARIWQICGFSLAPAHALGYRAGHGD